MFIDTVVIVYGLTINVCTFVCLFEYWMTFYVQISQFLNVVTFAVECGCGCGGCEL